MATIKYFFTIAFFIFLYSNAISQELPPIESFTLKDYEADNQNWAISQSSNKFIYVANNKGLLEYNGADWHLYSTPNQTIMRSVHAVEDKIYTGCYMEFGFWTKDKFGKLDYTSLSKDLTDLIEDEQFWKIINIKQYVLFQSLDRIYVYDTVKESFNVITPNSPITKMYQVEDDVYFQEFENGIFRIENGLSVKIIDYSLLKDQTVVNIFKNDSGLLLLTSRNGFYQFNNNGITKWVIDSNENLEGITFYSAKKLNDGSFLLGTISNGMILLDQKGQFIYQIDQSKGLENNTVLSVFQDLDNNIWLALDNGLNFINFYSPYKIYNDFSGKLGTIYVSIIYNNSIYLGTNQGLFIKKVNTQEAFSFVKGTNGQVWSLREINGELFCGHDQGTFIISNEKATRISNIQGTWDIKPIPNNQNLILQGNYNGLNILEKTAAGWVFRNKVSGFDISSRYFEFYNDDTVFVSHEYKGIFKINLLKTYEGIASIEKEEKFEKGLYSSLIKYKKDIIYANKNGVYKYVDIKRKFEKDSTLSRIYSKENYTSGKLIHDRTNKLWGFSKYGITYLESGNLSETPEFIEIAMPQNELNSMNGYENIAHLYNEEYLIGTSHGYIMVDLSKFELKEYEIVINSIEVGNINSDFETVDKSVEGIFKNKNNNVRISFSTPEYYKYSINSYQYNLDGYNNQWSNWSTNSSHYFENLPHGEYIFQVKGKVGKNVVSNMASYKFIIEKPWYLSNLFIIIYVLGGLFILLIIHFFYGIFYKKQREKLLRQTQKDLELQELENREQLMTFKNEKLQDDIKSKNRELAISTMSLIKKNEFLNNIKEELKKTNKSDNLNPIIKIIDKNINNTNDWALFEEAFNNADKDFLKKVKLKHPPLTPNDLRLCAYLRLNLSSKEIAPLLNISVRSVEVKRYRLRKKMNLQHETSLTDYILEL